MVHSIHDTLLALWEFLVILNVSRAPHDFCFPVIPSGANLPTIAMASHRELDRKRQVIRRSLSPPAAMFCSLTAAGLHEALGSPSGASTLAAILASFVFLSSLGLWVLSDARQRHHSLPYDFGSFVFFGWLLVVPVYLFSTRGWRACVPLGFFVLLCLVSALICNLPSFLVSLRP